MVRQIKIGVMSSVDNEKRAFNLIELLPISKPLRKAFKKIQALFSQPPTMFSKGKVLEVCCVVMWYLHTVA